ncbi:hypothetical protein VPH35_132873 [Triticum aestivum]
MEPLAEEILRQILVKLPTRDLARSCCVLHANATHVTSDSGVQTLLVSRESGGGRMDRDMVIQSVSSAKLMCRITDVADWPVYVCNPVTGDKLMVLPPPNTEGTVPYHRCGIYAMGFSASTHQYKLFRLSTWSLSNEGGYYLDVYTLGGYDGWCRRLYMFPYRATNDLHSSRLPVLVDGELHVLTKRPRNSCTLDTILVIDVTSETQCTYHLPEEFTGLVSAAVHAFQMSGKAMRCHTRRCQRFIHFSAMPPLQAIGTPDDDGDKQRAGWFDDSNETLCYRLGDLLNMYDTTKDEQQAQGYFFRNWEFRIPLPVVPWSESQQLNVYGGYRASLVSPRLIFACVPYSLTHHQDEQGHFVHSLLHALRWQKSLKKSSSMCPPNRIHDQRAAKRVHWLN